MPWLVLFLTSEAWALGLVMSLFTIPMSVFMLLGGVIVDRFSSKQVLLVAKYANAFFLFILSLLLYFDALTLSLLCLLAILMGTSSAFTIPAASSFLPGLVSREQLQAANSIGISLRTIVSWVGPLSAALLIGTGKSSAENLALVFLLDGLSVLFSALILHKVIVRQRETSPELNFKQGIVQACGYFWQHKALREIVIYVAVIGLFIAGPIGIGLPLFIKEELGGGAGFFGYLMSAEALGIFTGVTVAGKFSTIGKLTLGQSLLLADGIVGVALAALSLITSLYPGLFLLFIIGMVTGYAQVSLITWVQQQASPHMLGRLMSIVMFIVIGLAPLSTGLCGLVMTYIAPGTLFIVSGAGLIAVALSALFLTQVSRVQSNNAHARDNL